MIAVPPGWALVPLGDVAGITARLVNPADYPNLPHVAPNNIESGTGRLLAFRTVSEDGVTSPKFKFAEGEVLYSKIRPYLAKATLARFDGLCSADMYPLTTEEDPSYLTYWLISPMFTELASEQQGRSLLPKINREALFQLPIPLPPRSEQQRIVALLDEQLSRLDEAVGALRKTLDKAFGLRVSILRDAFAGRLPELDSGATQA